MKHFLLLLFCLLSVSFSFKIRKRLKDGYVIHNPILTSAELQSSNSSNLGICYGQTTQWSKFPFIVALRGACGCTGSIIDLGDINDGRPATILTAAHCKDCIDTVYVGCNNPSNCAGSHAFKANKDSWIDWDYVGSSFSNDIAVFQTEIAIDVDEAKAVTLNSVVVANVEVNTVTGYGIDQTGTAPQTLQTGNTNFVVKQICEDNYPGIIDSSMLCARDKQLNVENPTSVCSGDSGGPWTGANGRQFGVTSFGKANLFGCSPYSCRCCPQYPAVSANVAHFFEKICDYVGPANLQEGDRCIGHNSYKSKFTRAKKTIIRAVKDVFKLFF